MNTVFSIMLMAYTASLVVHFVVASMAIDTMQKTMARRGSLPRWTHDYCERAGAHGIGRGGRRRASSGAVRSNAPCRHTQPLSRPVSTPCC